MLVQLLRGCHQPEAISLGMQRCVSPGHHPVTSSMARLCSQAGEVERGGPHGPQPSHRPSQEPWSRGSGLSWVLQAREEQDHDAGRGGPCSFPA